MENQNHVLQEMLQTAQSMRVMGRKHLYQFQKGLIISSQSLPKLYGMVKEKYGISYIMTYRLNQDGLEHLFACLRQMGGRYEHPNTVAVKHRVRIHLLGKDSALVGDKYNLDRESSDVNISEGKFTDLRGNKSGNSVTDANSLERELCLSAMLFASLDENDESMADNTCNDHELDNLPDRCQDLENEMKSEGLRYFGGFIVRKFPKYEFLGSNVEDGDNTWIEHVAREKGKLMKPSQYFFEQLKTMENLFTCHHGKYELKPGKSAVKTLTSDVAKFVSLPVDVITYFVRCRMFFRMRTLNRKNSSSTRKKEHKISKLIS